MKHRVNVSYQLEIEAPSDIEAILAASKDIQRDALAVNISTQYRYETATGTGNYNSALNSASVG